MNFVWEQIEVKDGEPSEKILIVARRIEYVIEWCRIHKINMGSPNVWFVKTITNLQGAANAYYVDLGTDNQELRTLLERLKNLGHIKPLLVPNI